ncbi:PEP-CTERM system TPR-repeat protein PrsT [Geomonas sp. Red69]|uniref:XrtA/PEP-CTERM system TPR-repeat protein PrsT n=1 Tax=Geomonas diazotrophica TaxID=2843197 RepID=UPI001C0F688D|nr:MULTISPECIES: XrtA/PEP-CTERM system TPR-repeat protein PrsT [Geomonas]MBU5638135.1 PEP-CTERM system TPR-repeat protein PrsT [Geomonas diazotrophica]QXE84945.1 PEP-CTERM system TPR-repeat protein PrsT [Geomonas nitrogeniifigens]
MKVVVVILLALLVIAGCGSKTKETLYEEGVKQLKAANPAGAVVYFKNALEKDANYYDARLQLAKAYADLGKNDQAEREYLKVLTQNPSHDAALLELARLYVIMGKGDDAYDTAQKYLARRPGDPEGLEVVGGAYAVRGKYQESLGFLERALAADPRRASTLVQLASVHLVLKHTDKAKSLLNQVVQLDTKNFKALFMLAGLEAGSGNMDRAGTLYQKVLQLDPSRLDAQYKLGLIEVERRRLESAESVADRMIKEYPKRGEGYRLKGVVSYYRKAYGDAITQLQQSVKLAPSMDGYQFLGLSYYSKGELENALSQFRIILDKSPSSRQARLMTAQILLAQKHVEDAVSEIKKVLAADDSDAVAHNLLGNAYLQQGLFEDGMRELNRATTLDPKLVQAHLKKGAFYLSRGKGAEGETELASAVRAAPDALNSRLLLAAYHQRQGRTDKAISVLREGLNGGRRDALIYNALAGLQFGKGDQAAGVKSLTEAKRVDPLFPASYLNLSAQYATRADYGRAMAELTELHNKVPGNLRALLGLAALSELSGKDNDALSYYQKATRTGVPEAWVALAAYHQKKNNPGKALAVLDEAVQSDQRAVVPREAKGFLLLTLKDYKKVLQVADEMEPLDPDRGIALKIKAYTALKQGNNAVQQAQRLIARHPTSARGYLVLASVYQLTGDTASALAQAGRAAKAEPKSAEPLIMLGELHRARKEYPAAQAAFQDALKVQPDSAAAGFALASLIEGEGKKQEAVSRYRSIVEEHGSFVPALNNLAYLCAEGYGKKEEALRYAITAFRLEPGNAGVMDTLGYALYRNGHSGDAVKVLERAANLMPRDPTVRYHLGLAYHQAGNRVKSQQALQESLSFGEYPDRKAAQTLLAQLKK